MERGGKRWSQIAVSARNRNDQALSSVVLGAKQDRNAG